jgi:CRISPR system Cascade subunit CasB
MHPDEFFQELAQLAEADSAVVAVLRRSASYDPGLYPPAFPSIEPYVHGLGNWQRKATYLAAACWAQGTRRNHGEGLAFPVAARTLRNHQSMGSKSIEQRFTALLDADSDELQWRLRHLTTQLAAAAIPMDWPALLKDLWAWNSQTRYVQIKWAREFWSTPPAKSTTKSAGKTIATSTN